MKTMLILGSVVLVGAVGWLLISISPVFAAPTTFGGWYVSFLLIDTIFPRRA